MPSPATPSMVWRNWQTAEPGTRVENVHTGWRGTFVRTVDRGGTSRYAIVEWDEVWPSAMPSRPVRGRVFAPAFDLRPIDPD